MDITSSINRYIAKYSAVNDHDGVNRTLSSIFVVSTVIGIIIIGVSSLFSFVIIDFVHFDNSDNLKVARWIIFTLGASMGLNTLMSPFGGTLTGNHRWDLHNQAYAVSNVLNFVLTLAALYLKMGLIGCAFANLIAELIGWGLRAIYSFWKFPYLKIRLKYASFTTARTMVKFGGKSFIPRIGELISNQTINVLITTQFGAASLALFSRPRALIRIIQTFIMKYALVFTPAASSIQSRGNKEELKDLFIRAQFFGNVLCLPAILFLVLMGGNLLELWMGVNYRNSVLIAVMSISQLAFIANASGYSVISGLNKHGKLSIIMFIGQCSSLVIAWVMLFYLKVNLEWIPLALGIPMTLVYGLYLPFFACRELEIIFSKYFLSVYKVPLLCMVPYSACLILCKIFLSDNNLLILGAGASTSGAVLIVLYWKYVLPAKVKMKIIRPLLKKERLIDTTAEIK